MSIISCTSPRPSCRILPDSSVTNAPEVLLRGAQLLAEKPHELAAARRGNVAPDLERRIGAFDHRVDLGAGMGLERRDSRAVDRCGDLECAVGAFRFRELETAQNVLV